MVWACGINPARMRDERNTQLSLETAQTAGKQGRCRDVLINAAAVVVPGIIGALRVKPTVELNIAEADACTVKIRLHSGERLFIRERVSGVVVICRAIVGPVT